MQKYNSIPRVKKVLGATGTSRTGAEIVNVPYGLVLEGDGGAAGGNEDDAPVFLGMAFDECFG